MFRFLTAVILFLFVSVSLRADTVEWSVGDGGNGHWYEVVVSDGISWSDAKAAAELAGGYLATITSEVEDDFIYSLAYAVDGAWNYDGSNNIGPWLGASDAETEGIWKWVSGEPFSFSSWTGGQPNGNGDCLNIYGSGHNKGNLWNDYPDDSPYAISYVIEYEYEPAEVPEPSLAAGLLLALGGCALVCRRKK